MAADKRYKVFADGYIPQGKWNEQPGLMDFKAAAAYAAKVAGEDGAEKTQITVWDANLEAAEKQAFTDKATYSSELNPDGEHAYIATAIANAVAKRKRRSRNT